MLPAFKLLSAEWDALATVGDHYVGLRRHWDGTWSVEVWPVNHAHRRMTVYYGTQFPEDARGVWLRIVQTGTFPVAVHNALNTDSKEVA